MRDIEKPFSVWNKNSKIAFIIILIFCLIVGISLLIVSFVYIRIDVIILGDSGGAWMSMQAAFYIPIGITIITVTLIVGIYVYIKSD